MKFYVFYDKEDNVDCCGTAKQLVNDGFFKDECAVRSHASKITKKYIKGNVVILPLNEKDAS